ncbi:NADH-ubiquinone oxidoreductase-F iron-sulfur binding region domain-containing protein [Emcibacter sp. SYSU 3D8]|uniref:NADH-ubiquinone oxidoreductase-F iron-sulfur binding region domain-containing protein n=1 Tax=Emcibacter sp. SYSU 3D8 TaxID=3133969 RepID=UPI0031FEAC05
MKSETFFVSSDSASVSVGADDLVRAITAEAARRGIEPRIVRTGSRGLYFLEPMFELETQEGRFGFQPEGTMAECVTEMFDIGVEARTCLGLMDDLPWLHKQERLTFERCGIVDPRSINDYRFHGGFLGLERALGMAPEDIVAAVTESGLRGRGGAGFPAGVKWSTVRGAPGDVKYVCCNADEGDSGTFADRMLMEGDPFLLIEGMIIAGLAVGAGKGFIYIRSEYPAAIQMMRQAIETARIAGWLGGDIRESGKAFDIEIREGAGAYVCGEETAMLESLEGKRGMVRAKPPLPALEGLFGRPTVVNNVLTLAAVPMIVARGAAFYRNYGMGHSRGTQPFQLAGCIRNGGLVEKAFGTTLRTLIEDFGGGTATGRPLKAVQVGGPLGGYIPEHLLDLPADYEALAEAGFMLGHGGLVVFDDRADMLEQARFAMEFCAIESCGKCTPCRLGAQRGVEVIDRVAAGVEPAKNLALLDDLCTLMKDGSLCALGGLTPMPVRTALYHFPGDFERAAAQGDIRWA